jgi:serine/threonine protein kinase
MRQSANVGTPHYIAPEQTGTKYDNKVDIYPLGLILCELHQKFSTQHERGMAFNAVKHKRELPAGFVE